MSDSEKSALPVQVKDSDSKAMLQQVLEIANQLYAVGQFISVNDLVAASAEQGIPLGWKDVMALSAKFGQHEKYLPPEYLIEFLLEYTEDKTYDRVLDPCSGKGIFLNALADAGRIKTQGIGICPGPEDLELAQTITRCNKLKWEQGNPLEKLKPEDHGEFDLIICWPPLDLPVLHMSVPRGKDEEPIKIEDNSAHLLAAISCSLLSEKGEAIFIFSDAFFQREANNTLMHLKDFGLQMHSVVAVPPGAMGVWAPIPLNLVFIGRTKHKKIFAGQLTPKGENAELLKNLKERNHGSIREHGRLVPPSQFRSWREVVLDEEIDQIASRENLEPVELISVSEKIIMGTEVDPKEGFEPLPNAFYISLVGWYPVVTRFDVLKMDPRLCAQIIVDEEKAFPDYVAGFLNTPLGAKVREKMYCRSLNRQITRDVLKESQIYLPVSEVQTRVVSTQNKINELMFELDEQSRKLWQSPGEVEHIQRVINALDQQEGIESWIESLPFPLASILWRYHADPQPHMKNSHLFNFFEATALFTTILFISAYFENRAFFKDNHHVWFAPSFDHAKFFKRTTFGYWMTIGERFAKFTRQMLQDPGQRSLCLRMFRTNRANFVEALSKQELYTALKTVNNYRNEWKAHGGVESEQEQERRLAALETELARIRDIFRGVFDDLLLISPKQSEYRGGTFHYTVTNLMGSRTIFRQRTVQTAEPMDAEKLFLLDLNSHEPLELLPLMAMFTSPQSKEQACYFYNRMDKEGMRWVSYHFDEEAERRMATDEDLLNLFDEILNHSFFNRSNRRKKS